MCSQCDRLAEANSKIKAATNARDVWAVVQELIDNDVPVPPQIVSLVQRMATMEEVLQERPDATKEERANLLIQATMDLNGPALDQEFSEFRDRAWDLIDTAGSIAVVEQDSTRRWLRMGTEVVNRSPSLVDVLGMFTALLAELGRQPELVAQIKEKNARLLDG